MSAREALGHTIVMWSFGYMGLMIAVMLLSMVGMAIEGMLGDRPSPFNSKSFRGFMGAAALFPLAMLGSFIGMIFEFGS